jgi:hypothetical protein
MKHYKFTCSIEKEEYTTSNIFLCMYIEAKNYVDALSKARKDLEEQYPSMKIDDFSNININFQWEDEE